MSANSWKVREVEETIERLAWGLTLEVGGVRGRNVGTGDSLRGRVKVVPSLRLDELSDNLRSNTERGESSLDSDESTGLLDRLDDGLNVERSDRAEVDDLNLDALLGERVGGLDGVADRLGVSDDGDVGSLSLNLALADGDDDCSGVQRRGSSAERSQGEPSGRERDHSQSSFMASSDMGNETPYMSSFSRTTQGLGSRMQAWEADRTDVWSASFPVRQL